MKRRKHRHENNEDNEDNKDTLSALPDCVLLHILSFLNVKDAVRTCLVSSRWKHLWKHLTTLTLNSSDFSTRKGFTNFVNRFLSLRDSPTALNALDFERSGHAEPRLFKRVVTYAVSHGANRLRLCCRIRHTSFPSFPPSLFSCQSLTSLDLGYPNALVEFPNSMNLPALTYLSLQFFSFCSGNDGRVEPFSTFNRLNTLVLYNCIVRDEPEPLCISSTTLLDLCIHATYDHQHYSNIVLFAPRLCTFAFTGNPLHKLTGSHLSSIKQVSIDILYESDYSVESSSCLLNWLIEITNMKSLTVTLRTLQALSLYPDTLKLKLTSWFNLKSLKINKTLYSYRYFVMFGRDKILELADGKPWNENVELQETIRAELKAIYSSILDVVIEFLLQNSPTAEVDKIF